VHEIPHRLRAEASGIQERRSPITSSGTRGPLRSPLSTGATGSSWNPAGLRNLRHTVYDDRRQFLDEWAVSRLGFLQLQARLINGKAHPIEEINPTLAILGDRVLGALVEENQRVVKVRALESELLQPHPTADENLARIEEVHSQIVSLGEIPDYEGALRLAGGLVGNLAASGRWTVRKLCAWAARLPGRRNMPSPGSCCPLAQAATRQRTPRAAAWWRPCRPAPQGTGERLGSPRFAASRTRTDGWNELIQQVRVQAAGDDVQPARTFAAPHGADHPIAHQQLEDRLARNPTRRMARFNPLRPCSKPCAG
jgi:hypothetical protein